MFIESPNEHQLHRHIAITCLIVLMICVWSWVEGAKPAHSRIAAALIGEQWLKIEREETHLGYMYTRAFRDLFGRHHFETSTHFLLTENERSSISKHLVFDATSLIAARYINATDRARLETVLAPSANASGLTATVFRGSRSQSQDVALDLAFKLADFLAFETWLDARPRGPGDANAIPSLDFERLRVIQRSYAVVEENETGYLVETAAPFSATRTQLDARYRTVAMEMPQVFTIRQSDSAAATGFKQMQPHTRFHFALNEPLDDHANITRLSLDVINAPAELLGQRISATAGRAPFTEAPDDHLGEALRYPIRHPQVQAIVQRAREQSVPLVPALVDEVNLSLSYAEGRPAGDVASALAQGYGECTDFADLLTSVSRAAGLPAATIFGLAYKDGPNPALMFHAWNVIYADGRWQAVDPTWNQAVADATHFMLSDREAAGLMLAHAASAVSFSVSEVVR